jgi:tetratricopeptide (TPR) repeat protein
MIVTYVAQSHEGAVRGFADAPLSLRLSNALVAYAKYLCLTVWPSHLGVYYPFASTGVPGWQVVGALFLLGSITMIAIHQSGQRPYLLMGWLWFLGTLVPVIGLVQVGGQTMADRYQYIPSIGLFLAIVFSLSDLATAIRINRVALAAVSLICLIVLGSLTAVQASRWRDSKTLFEYTLSVTPDNLVVQYNLGHALGQEKKYDEAIPHFLEALRIKPDFFDALINMGVTLVEQGKPGEAISSYRRALEIKPDSAKAHMQLALALVKQEKADEALSEFYKALDFAPMDSDVRTNLGLMLARSGKVEEAISQLNEAVRLNPSSPEAHNNLGIAFLMSGQPEKSVPHFSEALRLRPEFALAQDNLKRAERQLEGKQK